MNEEYKRIFSAWFPIQFLYFQTEEDQHASDPLIRAFLNFADIWTFGRLDWTAHYAPRALNKLKILWIRAKYFLWKKKETWDWQISGFKPWKSELLL